MTDTLAKPHFGRLYIGNKMVGKPFLNAPWFDLTANNIRMYLHGMVDEVFNPADEDRKLGFDPMLCPDGVPREGFDRRRTLKADWSWIADNSDGLVIGPDWESSTGTLSEIACHQALGLPVWESRVFFDHIIRDPEYLVENPLSQLPGFRYMI